MNKLEVGMYVRTKLGIIAKCTNVLEDCSYDFDRVVYQDNYNEDGFMEIPYLLIDKYIIKSSYNIIDLIEEGDYVNSYKVECVNTKYAPYGVYIDIPFVDSESIGCNEDLIRTEEIKSIVTKEQFESMKYEVSNE